MIIESKDPVKIVDDYEFLLNSGLLIPVTIDHKAGDTIDLNNSTSINVYLAPAPSMTDSSKSTPAKDITIYRSQLASVQHSSREVVELTADQRFEWAKELKSMGMVQ